MRLSQQSDNCEGLKGQEAENKQTKTMCTHAQPQNATLRGPEEGTVPESSGTWTTRCQALLK